MIREAVIMKRQRHPHILELLAAFVDGSDLWMVIPLVPGGSLESLHQEGLPEGLPLPRAKNVMSSRHGRTAVHGRTSMTSAELVWQLAERLA